MSPQPAPALGGRGRPHPDPLRGRVHVPTITATPPRTASGTSASSSAPAPSSAPSPSSASASASASSVEDRMAGDLSRRADVGTLRSLPSDRPRRRHHCPPDGEMTAESSRCNGDGVGDRDYCIAVRVRGAKEAAVVGVGRVSDLDLDLDRPTTDSPDDSSEHSRAMMRPPPPPPPPPSPPLVDFASNDYLGLARCPRQVDAVEAEFRRLRRRMTRRGPSSSSSQPPSAPLLLGATGSRLLSGDSSYAHDLERRIAAHHGRRPDGAALLFNSGYDANLSVLSCIPRGGDAVLMDELCHNSLVMGARMGGRVRERDVRKFRHNDVDHLVRLLKGWRRHPHPDADAPSNRRRRGFCFVVVESVYSMDGDVAPLREICDAALEHGARVIVDEAHGLGVFGRTNVKDLCIPTHEDADGDGEDEGGVDRPPIPSRDASLGTDALVETDGGGDRERGIRGGGGGGKGGAGGTGVLAALELERHPSILCAVYTFGKAAGCHGAAVVCSSELLKRYLVNYARPFVYSTALPPHSLLTIGCAYDAMTSSGGDWDGDERRRRVFGLVGLFRRSFLRRCGDREISIPPPSDGDWDGRRQPPLSRILIPSPSPIQSVLVPGNGRCAAVSDGLRRRGLDVYPVRSPTVPAGTERIRIVLHAHNEPGEVVDVVDALVEELTKWPPPPSSPSPSLDADAAGAPDTDGMAGSSGAIGRSRL